MLELLADPAFWSAVAAGGAFVTAVVIARSSKLDRKQQRELAARTHLSVDSAIRTEIGCHFKIRNDGPAIAWDVRCTVGKPESAGQTTDATPPGTPDPARIPVMLVGDERKVEAIYEAVGQGQYEEVAVELSWTEEHGHSRSLKFHTPLLPRGTPSAGVVRIRRS